MQTPAEKARSGFKNDVADLIENFQVSLKMKIRMSIFHVSEIVIFRNFQLLLLLSCGKVFSFKFSGNQRARCCLIDALDSCLF